MPTPLIKKYAKELNVSVESLEKKWEEAKKIAEKEGIENRKYFFAYVTKIFKNLAGVKDMKEGLISYEEFCSMDEAIEKSEFESIKKGIIELIEDKGHGGLDYREFAKIVADVLSDEYHSSLYNEFFSVLKERIKENG